MRLRRSIATPATFFVLLLAMAAQPPAASAQTSQSAPLAHQLSALMDARKLTTFAAPVPDRPNTYAAAFLIPGVQLLVVSGQPTAPQATQAALQSAQYADVYAILQQAVAPDTKLFVQDLKADGLYAKSPDEVDIVYEHVTSQTVFDGAPSRHHMTDAQYADRFKAADTAYAHILSVLVSALQQRTTAASGR